MMQKLKNFTIPSVIMTSRKQNRLLFKQHAASAKHMIHFNNTRTIARVECSYKRIIKEAISTELRPNCLNTRVNAYIQFGG